MVEVNPEERDERTEGEDVETNIYVAQTAGTEDDPDSVLDSGRSWISIRLFADAEVSDLDGNLIFAELNNTPKDVAIEILEMVIDTVRNGEKIEPEEATE